MEIQKSGNVKPGDLVIVIKSFRVEYLGKVFKVRKILRDKKGRLMLVLESPKGIANTSARLINPITGEEGPKMCQFPCELHHVMAISGFNEPTMLNNRRINDDNT